MNRFSTKKFIDKYLDKYCELNPEQNFDKAKIEIDNIILYYKGKNKNYKYELEERWYDSLNNDRIDFEVYDANSYYCDLFACYLIYSRGYINSLSKNEYVYKFLHDKTILDLGCGLGFTSLSLYDNFNCKIFSTNIKNTLQWNFCNKVKDDKFELYDDCFKIETNTDFIFASEYFEHIINAPNHLEKIINKINPKMICMANAFNTRSIGHFYKYIYKNNNKRQIIEAKKLPRIFSTILKEHNYEQLKLGFWNNRPQVWERKGLKHEI